MSGVIGAIDGCHIPIVGQEFCNESYVNRKGFTSIILQAVCDHKKRFIDCYVGWPGSVHDARVYSNSDLHHSIEQNFFKFFPNDSHLVGDAAYGLTRFMLTPYKDNGYLTHEQKSYNFTQASTRNVIERAFALLKGKFPRLKQMTVKEVDDICLFVMAACTLQNFIIDVEKGKYDEEFGVEDFEQDDEVNDYVCIGSSSSDAILKRDRVAHEIFNSRN